MKIEREFISFIDEFADTPLPSIRVGCDSARTTMSYHSDDLYSGDEFPDDLSVTETDEGRLSRSLQSWMPEHVIRSLEPREKPSPEPIFSGKLGKERPVIRKQYGRAKSVGGKSSQQRSRTAPIQRTDSEESLVTNLSLLTCSSGSHSVVETEPMKDKRRRRKKRVSHASMLSNEDAPFVSKWVELSNKQTGGALKSFMRTHNVLTAPSGGYIIDNDDGYGDESEAFRLFDKDEQDGLFQTGRRTGIKFINKETLKRSSSMSTIKVDIPKPKTAIPRILSASAKKARGKPIDLSEMKRERMNRLIAIEQAKYQEKEKHRRRKTSLGRRASARSITDSTTSGRPISPPTTLAPSVSAKTQSVHSSDMRPNSPTEEEEEAEERVTVWKGDREILEIDLNRELTHRVKKRIATTRSALTRVSGLGDSNEKKTIVGIHDEFPKHTEDDFCHRPRIIQKMRISPQLSGVIHDDIQVRMGRPRYHEIRMTDLVQFNKGQHLNKAHTNLKVFNWLHSLRESEFRSKVTEDIEDEVPDEDNLRGVDFLHVEAADEPEVKPLYRAYEVRLL